MRAPIYYALTPFLLGLTANSVIEYGYGSLLIGIICILCGINKGRRKNRITADRTIITALVLGGVLNIWLYIDFVTEIKEGIGNKYLDLPAREVECSIELSYVSNQFGKYGDYVYFKGVIEKVPEIRKDLINKTVKGMFKSNKNSIIIGKEDVITVKGIIEYNNINKLRLLKKNINYKIYYITKIIVERKSNINKIRSYIFESITHDKNTAKEYQGFVCAFLFGEKRFMTERQELLYRNIGTMHIFAVSGLHIGIAFFVLHHFLKSFLFRKKFYLPLTLLMLFCYVTLVGFPPSACRAYLMVLFWQISNMLCRKSNSFSVVGWTAFLLLLLDHSLLYSVGFQLSFTVVLSILWTLPKQTKKQSFLTLFKTSFLVSYASFFSSIILILDNFNQINPLSIIVNGLLMPFIVIIFILTLLYLITSLLYPNAFISNLTESIYLFIEHYSDFFNAIKFTHFHFPSDYYIHDSSHLIIPLMLVLTRGLFRNLWQKLAFMPFVSAIPILVNSFFN